MGRDNGKRVTDRGGLKKAGSRLNTIAHRLGHITEPRQAEGVLRESEEKLRRMFESVAEGIAVTDLKGVITEVNDRLLEIHGFGSKDEVLGRNFLELIVANEREKGMMNARRILEQGSIESVEYTLLKKDGSEVPGESSGSLLKDASGEAVGFIGITRDITERKQAQEALWALSRRLVEVQETERGDIARELEEQIGQRLTELKLLLGMISRLPAENVGGKLNEAQLHVNELIARVRTIAFDARPTIADDLGLMRTPLTNRERQVLRLAAEGLTNTEIASRLFIGRRTVETHRAHIMKKLRLRSQADLIRYALREKILSMDD